MQRAFVNAFLKEFRQIAEERGIYLVPRDKNIQGLTKLHITETIAKDEVKSLSAADFCSGPKQDADQSGEVWEFGKKFGKKEAYIKLKIAKLPDGTKIAKCISFHPAEHPLRYPLS
jgi:hypothetical protein